MLDAIAHPTDFSEDGAIAFEHALRLAVEFRCRLDILHVRSPRDSNDWRSFPHVRDPLARWGLLPGSAPVDDIVRTLGVRVRKVEIAHADAGDGIVGFVAKHKPDLVVMATHGEGGFSRWLSGSVSEAIARETHLPALFVGRSAQPFVDRLSGEMRLENILVPVARDPAPRRALKLLHGLFGGLGPRLHLLHVGDSAPWILDPAGEPYMVEVRRGPVVETIVAAGASVDLIVMPTAGHRGFLDALRGSTTEQVLHQAPCPVLALPA
jgi:nucleotide-binding universal stress UspA family protein